MLSKLGRGKLGLRNLSYSASRASQYKDPSKPEQQHESSMAKARDGGVGPAKSGFNPNSEDLAKDPAGAALERDLKSAADKWKNDEAHKPQQTAKDKAKEANAVDTISSSGPKKSDL